MQMVLEINLDQSQKRASLCMCFTPLKSAAYSDNKSSVATEKNRKIFGTEKLKIGKVCFVLLCC